MYVLLNMFITIIDRRRCRRLLYVISLLIFTLRLPAQENIVTTLLPMKLNPLQMELFAYAGGGSMRNTSLWTANNYVNGRDVYGTYLDMGLGGELYKSQFDYIRIRTTIGYKREKYAYNKSLSDNSGVYSNWLSADVSVIVLNYLGVGLKSNIFMGSKIRNKDNFTYEGLYSECFNEAALCLYGSYSLSLPRFKVEARVGGFIEPQFSPEKISYHNMTKTIVEGTYIEIRAFYRIFTTGRIFDASLF